MAIGYPVIYLHLYEIVHFLFYSIWILCVVYFVYSLIIASCYSVIGDKPFLWSMEQSKFDP